MINSFADILRALQLKEQTVLAEQAISHGPTIGDMYEGLTRDLLDRAIPASAFLRLVNGFVVGHDNTLSPQIDCLLVRGSGERIPYTDHYKWPVKDVIAVFEIKKRLYTTELEESHSKLREILRLYSEWVESHQNDTTAADIRPGFRAFAKLTGTYPRSYDDVHKLPETLQYIFHTMVMEHLSPVRIVFSYDGFVDEYGLRQGFTRYLDTHGAGQRGFGVGSFPTLVICGQNSIIKLNGSPYVGKIDRDGWWMVLASNAENPLRILLELIWTRLSFATNMEMPPDDTLRDEALHLLLSARLGRQGAKLGWEYKYASASKILLQSIPAPEPWKPVEIDVNEYTFLHVLLRKEGQEELTNTEFVEFIGKEGIDVAAFISRLVEVRLIARSGSSVRLIDPSLFLGFTPDGRSWAASDSHRFQLWLDDWMKRNPKKS
jgi:hypothetical protein